MTGRNVEAHDGATTRKRPSFETTEDGVVQVVSSNDTLRTLFGTKTHGAASGLMSSAVNALGRTGANLRPFIASMAAELEPTDAAEAMLVVQMSATHAAMPFTAQKVADASSYHVRESYERSMTRLSRTYTAQMDALKRYRAKAQQVVRVERVTVQDGGQAIVGTVTHQGRADVES